MIVMMMVMNKNEDNINLIVHAVLDEFKNSNNFPNLH